MHVGYSVNMCEPLFLVTKVPSKVSFLLRYSNPRHAESPPPDPSPIPERIYPTPSFVNTPNLLLESPKQQLSCSSRSGLSALGRPPHAPFWGPPPHMLPNTQYPPALHSSLSHGLYWASSELLPSAFWNKVAYRGLAFPEG